MNQCADIASRRLNKAHTGVYLAQKLVKSLEEYGIEKKVWHSPCKDGAFD